jgi:TM2 domain-containing membrane protein YozV
MVKFLLWCVLLVLCWPIALVALVLYPLVWLLLLPFRVVGIAVGGALDLVWAIVTLPARVVRALV